MKADKSAFFQPKLTINQPNDVYEQEADTMADHVMRTTDISSDNNSFFKPSVSSVQRKCAHCEEEEKKAQRKESDNNTTEASTETENYVNSLSGGNALDEKNKTFFESRMGYDLSNVRLHTDSKAAQSAQSINALAYTSGNNIVFDNNQYQPATESGKKLLAHELTHVVQQNTNRISKKIQRTINYIRQLQGTECQPYLDNFDRSLQSLETNAQSPQVPIPQEVLQAIQLLRRFRTEGRITCWEVSGGLVYASYDNATQQIRLHINFANAATTTTILHEAIHALHAANNPEIARVYGQILAEGGTTDRNLGILMTKWKAWTEYWAYRGTIEYSNSRQTDPQFRQDAHRAAMSERDVRASVQRVRELTGEDFDPSQWTPPARWRAPAAYRRRSP
jgi:hypothetical protein